MTVIIIIVYDDDWWNEFALHVPSLRWNFLPLHPSIANWIDAALIATSVSLPQLPLFSPFSIFSPSPAGQFGMKRNKKWCTTSWWMAIIKGSRRGMQMISRSRRSAPCGCMRQALLSSTFFYYCFFFLQPGGRAGVFSQVRSRKIAGLDSKTGEWLHERSYMLTVIWTGAVWSFEILDLDSCRAETN